MCGVDIILEAPVPRKLPSESSEHSPMSKRRMDGGLCIQRAKVNH